MLAITLLPAPRYGWTWYVTRGDELLRTDTCANREAAFADANLAREG
jgi:hypothetical protein